MDSVAPKSNSNGKAVFTLTVPLDRDGTNKATFQLKDMNEQVFMAAKSLIDADKHFDAVRMMVKALRVGGDDPALLADNWIAVSAASKLVIGLIEPLEGELKKN